jgi:hypothetical protein
MKSRSASEWVKAYDHIHQELTAKGFKPKLKTLDNEASAALKHFFTANDVEYQLVPPHCHRRNAAERESVRTGSHACLFSYGSPLDKILLGGGYGLISISFPNTLLDSCCVGMTGIPFFWFMVTLDPPADRAIFIFPIIMSHNCRNIRPCKGLVK